MRKHICFRVEDARGEGMYSAGPTRKLEELTYPNKGRWNPSRAHPAPSQDGLMAPEWIRLAEAAEHRSYSFGFSSLDQLRRWLYTEEVLQELQDNGFRISLYQTDDYVLGDTQMCFRLSSANLVGRADLI